MNARRLKLEDKNDAQMHRGGLRYGLTDRTVSPYQAFQQHTNRGDRLKPLKLCKTEHSVDWIVDQKLAWSVGLRCEVDSLPDPLSIYERVFEGEPSSARSVQAVRNCSPWKKGPGLDRLY
jgi:hypothetical protein